MYAVGGVMGVLRASMSRLRASKRPSMGVRGSSEGSGEKGDFAALAMRKPWPLVIRGVGRGGMVVPVAVVGVGVVEEEEGGDVRIVTIAVVGLELRRCMYAGEGLYFVVDGGGGWKRGTGGRYTEVMMERRGPAVVYICICIYIIGKGPVEASVKTSESLG